MSKFDQTAGSSQHIMTVNGLSLALNMPEALNSQGTGLNEHAHHLPPHRQRRAFLVDEYPACPETWMRSSGRVKSYFVPVVEGAGLWLDFNKCINHANHTGIVVSIQGVNAVTGLPCKDAALEQYRDECPKHKIAFGPDRLCKECNFKWPKQNYLSSTGTPYGQLWLDGFRAEDGVIRQYVFSAQKMRGVAANIIGESRVFALGISYFLSKEAKPPTSHVTRQFMSFGPMGGDGDDVPIGSSGGNTVTSWNMHTSNFVGMLETGEDDKCSYEGKLMSDEPVKKSFVKSSEAQYSASASLSTRKSFSKGGQNSAGPMRSAANYCGTPMATAAASIQKVTSVKQLEVAAGAKIDQRIYDDPNDLEFWQKEPEGLIIVNYCTEEDAEKIIAAGKVDLSGDKEGFLQKLPTGN